MHEMGKDIGKLEKYTDRKKDLCKLCCMPTHRPGPLRKPNHPLLVKEMSPPQAELTHCNTCTHWLSSMYYVLRCQVSWCRGKRHNPHGYLDIHLQALQLACRCPQIPRSGHSARRAPHARQLGLHGSSTNPMHAQGSPAHHHHRRVLHGSWPCKSQAGLSNCLRTSEMVETERARGAHKCQIPPTHAY